MVQSVLDPYEATNMQYWEDQERQPLNKLLRRALALKNVPDSYIQEAVCLPIENFEKVGYPATRMLVFSEADFATITLAFDQEITIAQYVDGLIQRVDIDLLQQRPAVFDPSHKKGKVTQAEILLGGWVGWFVENYPLIKRGAISEVYPYSSQIVNLTIPEIAYLGFYAKIEDGRLGWACIPIATDEEDTLEKQLQNITI